MNIQRKLSRLGIEALEEVDKKDVNYLAHHIANTITSVFPVLQEQYNEILARILNCSMYYAKIGENIATVNYVYDNDSIYIDEDVNIFEPNEQLFREVIHYLQVRRNNKGKIKTMGLCRFSEFSIKGLGLNEGIAQYMASKMVKDEKVHINKYGVYLFTISPNQYPMITNLVEQLIYLLGENLLVKATIGMNSDFEDEDKEDLKAKYEMAVYDGKKCQEQGQVSVPHEGTDWEEILYYDSLGSTMLNLKNETADGGNIPQIAEKTTEKSANIQTLTAEEESYRAYQQYINQGKVIEDYCKDIDCTLESVKNDDESYESDPEDTTNYDDLRIYFEGEEWLNFNYGLAKLDADDSLEMVVTTEGRSGAMYYTYKDGKVQRITAKDSYGFLTIYYREKHNKMFVNKVMEADAVERELTTYSDDQLKVEITYGTDYFGYGGAEQYEINNKRVSKAKYKKSLAEKTGGNQGWKCIWFGDSLQESYQKGNEESKIY